MPDFELTTHAEQMLEERGITVEWLHITITAPEWQEKDTEGNVHLFRTIPEYGARILHVIVNPSAEPPKVVTLFFDRRARRPS